MLRTILTVFVALGAGLAMGAKGCSVAIETDATNYEVGQEGMSTLVNDGSEPAFLSGCAAFNFEKLEGTTWVDAGPSVICVWEGFIQKVEVGATFETPFVPTEPGTFRHRYRVGFDCTEGVATSQANCAKYKNFYSNTYEVVDALGTCDFFGRTFQEGESFTAEDYCNSCTCMGDDQLACTKRACPACSGDEWYREYKSTSAEQCMVMKFYCPPNQYMFSDECGCGCQQAPWCEETYDCEPPTDCSEEQAACPYSTFAL